MSTIEKKLTMWQSKPTNQRLMLPFNKIFNIDFDGDVHTRQDTPRQVEGDCAHDALISLAFVSCLTVHTRRVTRYMPRSSMYMMLSFHLVSLVIISSRYLSVACSYFGPSQRVSRGSERSHVHTRCFSFLKWYIYGFSPTVFKSFWVMTRQRTPGCARRWCLPKTEVQTRQKTIFLIQNFVLWIRFGFNISWIGFSTHAFQ